MTKYNLIGGKLAMRKLLNYIDSLHPLLNLVITSGFHGVVTALFGLVGLAHYAAFAYCFREADQVLTKLSRGKPLPRGWALADSVADALVPVAVACLYAFA
jgi:hypothetical protein